MKPTANPLKAITCNILGHKMVVSHVVNDRINEYRCCNCGKQMTSTIYGQLVPLNDHYSRINRSLSQLARKKVLRQRVA